MNQIHNQDNAAKELIHWFLFGIKYFLRINRQRKRVRLALSVIKLRWILNDKLNF